MFEKVPKCVFVAVDSAAAAGTGTCVDSAYDLADTCDVAACVCCSYSGFVAVDAFAAAVVVAAAVADGDDGIRYSSSSFGSGLSSSCLCCRYLRADTCIWCWHATDWPWSVCRC